MTFANPVVIVAGTRPEVIKLAPIYREFLNRNVKAEFWLSGQHSTLAEGPAEFFEIECALKLNLLKPGQSSNELFSNLLSKLGYEYSQRHPLVVIVQGDTTTALAGALAAFHLKIPVAHVEAGLRSGDLNSPFPEEMNRRVIDVFSKWRFPPTELSRSMLLKEGCKNVSEPTGNTGIDALFWARDQVRKLGQWPIGAPQIPNGLKLILSTGHRRENLGKPMTRILKALGHEIQERSDTFLIHVAHPNPIAYQSAVEAFKGLERFHMISALNYPDFVALLDRASVVVTDSGGIQEEAPSFGLPVLITREETERPEVLECGGVLVGTDPNLLKTALNQALQFEKKSESLFKTPFGDGQASRRIVDDIVSGLEREASHSLYKNILSKPYPEIQQANGNFALQKTGFDRPSVNS